MGFDHKGYKVYKDILKPTSTIPVALIWKSPKVAESYGCTDCCHNKIHFVAPCYGIPILSNSLLTTHLSFKKRDPRSLMVITSILKLYDVWAKKNGLSRPYAVVSEYGSSTMYRSIPRTSSSIISRV